MQATKSVRYFLFLLASLLLAWAPPLANAQGTTGSIAGTVSDEQGSAIAGATVIVQQIETGAVRVLGTDERGRYEAPGLASGTYSVRVEQSGFQASLQTGIEIALGRFATVDTVLQVGALTDEVEVVAKAPLVDRRSSTISGLVDQKIIRELPLNARNFVQLTTLEPGVQQFRNVGEPTSTFPGSGRGLRIAVNGARPEMNNYMIDGIDVGDAYNNSPGSAAGLFLGVETLREFQVLTSNFTAEFGRVGGGIINAVTRSGSNEFHGSVFAFHRNDRLNSKNHFDEEKPDFDRNQFGFVLSGPLVKDKTFFLLSYEGFRETNGRTIVSIVPDDAARLGILPDPNNPGSTIRVPVSPVIQPYLDLYPRANRDVNPGDGIAEHAFVFDQDTDQDFFTLRLDHRFTDNHSIFVRYILDDADILRPINFPQFGVSEKSKNQFLAIGQQSILSPTLLNNFRFGWTRTDFDSRDVELTSIDPGLSFLPGFDFGTLVVGGLSNMGITTFGPTNTPKQDLFTFADDLTLTAGPHLLKVGANYQRFKVDESNSLLNNGLWNFFSLSNFLQNRPFAFLGSQVDSDIARRYRQTLFGAYIQDEFKVSSNLTLNLGVRFELVTSPTEVDGKLANLRDPVNDAETTVGEPFVDDSNLKKFAPRFGFVWDPRGNGKTSVRGGVGLFYHQPGYSYFFRALIYSPPFNGFGALPAPPVGPPFVRFPRIPTRFFPANIMFPTQFELDAPRMLHYNFTVQHEILRDTVVTAGYIGSRGENLGRVTEINTFRFREVDGEKFFTPGPRVNPNWVGLNVIDTNGDSWYNSLQVGINKRFSRGFGGQVSYTYGHCVDNAPPLLRDVESGPNIVMDALDPDRDRANCNTDMRHNLTFNYTWDLPFGDANKGLLGGWQISGITQILSGTPFTVENGFDRARTGKIGPFATDRPDLADGASSNPILGGPVQYFDPNAFVLQDAGFYGDLGRNTLVGPGLQNWDVALVKNTRVGEGASLQLRFEVFNLFNRANFSVPTGPGRIAFVGARPGPGAPGVRNPVAGRIFRTVTPARQFQFGVKLLF